jgi:hypothetical protein
VAVQKSRLLPLLKTRKGALAAAGAAGVVVIVVGASALLWLAPGSSATPSPGSSATASASATASESPTAVATEAVPSGPPGTYADIDGVATQDELAHRLPMAIMIDDQPSARPQAGFNAASIVWQAPADGGQTRYMFVFQEGEAADIGPVRSGRPYFVRWATEYRGVFGHFGGDNETLTTTVPQLHSSFWDMDGLTGRGGCPYHRVSTRLAPHNAYTNTAELYRCAANLGYPETFSDSAPTYTFVGDSPVAERPTSAWILLQYRGIDVRYDFDAAADDYARSLDGQPHIDAGDNKRVRARNVAVLFQSLTTYTEPGHVRPVLGSVGSGEALVFLEGRLITAKWEKKTDTSLTRFLDSAGQEIPFVRGQIFMQVVPIGTKVTYQAG